MIDNFTPQAFPIWAVGFYSGCLPELGVVVGWAPRAAAPVSGDDAMELDPVVVPQAGLAATLWAYEGPDGFRVTLYLTEADARADLQHITESVMARRKAQES